MNTTTKDATELYADRRKRFNDILDGYECGAGDYRIPVEATPDGGGLVGTFPHMRLAIDVPEDKACKPGRWVVVTHSEKGHGYFIDNVIDRDEVEAVAGQNIHEGWQPVCYYDLDQLAGDEPEPDEGDIVMILPEYARPEDQARHLHVCGVESKDGRRTLDLGSSSDPQDFIVWAYADDVKMIERAEDDERMPVRYQLAKVTIVVAFNSTAEAP